MASQPVSFFAMCGFLIAGLLLAGNYFRPDLEMITSLPAAFGQAAGGGFGNQSIGSGPQDPSNVDAGDPGDPSAGLNSTDVSPDASGNLGSPDLNDTLEGQNMSNPDAASQISNPGAGNTSSVSQSGQAVPEFGPLSSMILGASIVFVLLMGTRAFFRRDL